MDTAAGRVARCVLSFPRFVERQDSRTGRRRKALNRATTFP